MSKKPFNQQHSIVGAAVLGIAFLDYREHAKEATEGMVDPEQMARMSPTLSVTYSTVDRAFRALVVYKCPNCDNTHEFRATHENPFVAMAAAAGATLQGPERMVAGAMLSMVGCKIEA